MTDDDALRASLHRAAGSPSLANREDLMSALVERVEAGGVDLAQAPAPHAAPATNAGAPSGSGSRLRRFASRLAGLGLAGWITVAAGSAAAAAGAWLVLGPTSDDEPEPMPTPSPSASPSPDARPTAPLPSIVPSHLPVVGEVGDDIDDVVRDTVGPVVSAVRVFPASGLVGDVTCDIGPTVNLRASDESGVAAVSLRVAAHGVPTVTVPLTRGSGDSWTGVAPALSLVGELTIDVIARDGAGNETTVSATHAFEASCPG